LYILFICANGFSESINTNITPIPVGYTDSSLYVGVFRDSKTQKELFQERRQNYFSQGEMVYTRITYHTPTGEMCAVKETEYGENKYQPKLIRMELPFDRQTTAIIQNDIALVEMQTGGKKKASSFSVPQRAILDEGFQHYIRDNFEILMEGQSLSFPLVVVERDTYYNFTLNVQKIDLDKKEMLLSMSPKNWVLSLLVKSIYLTVNTETQEMKGYQGILNFASCAEEGLFVTGTFTKESF
jgi:hypothetical protein